MVKGRSLITFTFLVFLCVPHQAAAQTHRGLSISGSLGMASVFGERGISAAVGTNYLLARTRSTAIRIGLGGLFASTGGTTPKPGGEARSWSAIGAKLGVSRTISDRVNIFLRAPLMAVKSTVADVPRIQVRASDGLTSHGTLFGVNIGLGLVTSPRSASELAFSWARVRLRDGLGVRRTGSMITARIGFRVYLSAND